MGLTGGQASLAFVPERVASRAVIAHGDGVSECGGLDARQSANTAAELAIKIRAALFVEAQFLHIHGEIQNVLGLEAEVRLFRVLQAAQEEACHDEHNERAVRLRDDQNTANAIVSNSTGKTAAALSKRVVQIDARGTECRNETCEQAGRGSHRADEEEHAPVKRLTHAQGTANAGEANRLDPFYEPHADRCASERTHCGKQKALGEQLAKQAQSVGSESRANRHFLCANRGARKQKI